MSDWELRAASADLTYIQSFDEGFSRKKCGKGFKYVDATGKLITSVSVRKRLQLLLFRRHGKTSGFAWTPKVTSRQPE